jgi:P pilus assembly chaperone PapD
MRFIMRFITTTGLALAMSALTLSQPAAGVIIGGTRSFLMGLKKKRQSASITLTVRLI